MNKFVFPVIKKTFSSISAKDLISVQPMASTQIMLFETFLSENEFIKNEFIEISRYYNKNTCKDTIKWETTLFNGEELILVTEDAIIKSFIYRM